MAQKKIQISRHIDRHQMDTAKLWYAIDSLKSISWLACHIHIKIIITIDREFTCIRQTAPYWSLEQLLKIDPNYRISDMDKNRERIIQENCDQKCNCQVELYVVRKVLSVLSIYFSICLTNQTKKNDKLFLATCSYFSAWFDQSLQTDKYSFRLRAAKFFLTIHRITHLVFILAVASDKWSVIEFICYIASDKPTDLSGAKNLCMMCRIFFYLRFI